MHRKSTRALALTLTLFISHFCLAKDEPRDTCLMFAARNIAKGNANFFIYVNFAKGGATIAKGDNLEYDIFLDPKIPAQTGGVDFDTDDANFRDTRTPDQN